MGAADLETQLLQDPGHAVPDGGGGGQGEVHDAEGHPQAAAGLLGHQLAHAGHPEGGLLDGLRRHIQGLAPDALQGVVDHARAGDAHVDDLLGLPHPVEGSGHEGVVLHGVAKDHQLRAAETVLVRGAGGGRFHDLPHQADGIHVDARPGGAHVDGGADQLRLRQRLRDGADELLVRRRHALLHESGVAADEVDAAGLGGPVQGQGEGDVVLRAAGGGHQGHGGHGDPLIDDGDAELPLDGFAGGHQLFRAAGDLLVDLGAGGLGVGVAAGEEGDPHGDGADVQVLLVDHLNGGEDVLLI